MKIQILLGLCLGTSLLFAGTAALADDKKSNNRSARAVQVHIDKEGRKTMPDDSDVAALAAESQTITAADADAIMPAENQAPVQNADGSVSARLGQESMRYLTLSIGEDGEKVVRHETIEEFESRTELEPENEGVE